MILVKIKPFLQNKDIKKISFMFLLGLSSGLPYLLVFSSLSAWLREYGISRTEIGYISWVGLAYGLKVFWAPLVDNVTIYFFSKKLGRRKAWIFLSQFLICLFILLMSYTDFTDSLFIFTILVICLAISSATQDLVIDAYRIDYTKDEKQALMAAAYVYGYRIALLISGGGVLLIADTLLNWEGAYQLMSLFAFLILLITLIFLPEKKSIEALETGKKEEDNVALWFVKVFFLPIKSFFKSYGFKSAILMLLLISFYRVSDTVMGVMANPFYIDIGFSKTEIGLIVKSFGLAMVLLGLAIGGIVTLKLGLKISLVIGAVLSASSNLLFVLLSNIGAKIEFLTLTIMVDNLASGMTTVIFIAYLSSITNKSYSATQYGLFTSLMVLLPKFLAGFSGVIVDSYGYNVFFTFTAILGIPVIFLIFYVYKIKDKNSF